LHEQWLIASSYGLAWQVFWCEYANKQLSQWDWDSCHTNKVGHVEGLASIGPDPCHSIGHLFEVG